ncbi:helix-turn-helix domain-containing protein [Motilibacter aurantiacus]|uniref:helix-turn-helix domain-containing protein n=1 Tax=Motilibacter aurantiacus TaxID=2714955 RepID=UPI0014077060|nr:helix-turn-helix transcriptional regulator [Motilibacter aurantiacus]NHC46841.1 helix-turn-helix transcriptional regulator [Motilibacter aurantiacus]
MAKLDMGALGESLRDPRALAGQSLRKVAEAAGSAAPYLEQVERSARGPAADVVSQVARGLRQGVDALGSQAAMLADSAAGAAPRPEPSDVRSAVESDPALTDSQRAVLLDIYGSFLAENARGATDVRDR